MPIYNLIEYSWNYPKTTGNLLIYFKEKATNFNNDIESTDDFKSFKNKTKLLGNTKTDGDNGTLKNATIAFPLRYPKQFKINFGDHSKYH